MKLFSIALFGLSLLAGSLSKTPKTDIEATSVLDQRTSMNGVYYNYSITNTGNTTIPADSYSLHLKVNGKTVSFDKDTQELKPGQSILYKSKKTTYQKRDENLDYALEIDFKDDDTSNNVLTGTTIF